MVGILVMIALDFCAIYLLSSLLNWAIVKRVFDDQAHQVWVSVGAAFLMVMLLQWYNPYSGDLELPSLVSGDLGTALVAIRKYYPLRKSAADFVRVSTVAITSFLVLSVAPFAASSTVATAARTALGQPDQVSLNFITCTGTLSDITTGEALGDIRETYRVNEAAKTIEFMDEKTGEYTPYPAIFEGQVISMRRGGNSVVSINRLSGDYSATATAGDKGKEFRVKIVGKCEKAKAKF